MSDQETIVSVATEEFDKEAFELRNVVPQLAEDLETVLDFARAISVNGNQNINLEVARNVVLLGSLPKAKELLETVDLRLKQLSGKKYEEAIENAKEDLWSIRNWILIQRTNLESLMFHHRRDHHDPTQDTPSSCNKCENIPAITEQCCAAARLLRPMKAVTELKFSYPFARAAHGGRRSAELKVRTRGLWQGKYRPDSTDPTKYGIVSTMQSKPLAATGRDVTFLPDDTIIEADIYDSFVRNLSRLHVRTLEGLTVATTEDDHSRIEHLKEVNRVSLPA
jgi:hypothetical protein